MPRRTTVALHLAIEELHRRFRQSTDSVERTPWQSVRLMAAGDQMPDFAALVG